MESPAARRRRPLIEPAFPALHAASLGTLCVAFENPNGVRLPSTKASLFTAKGRDSPPRTIHRKSRLMKRCPYILSAKSCKDTTGAEDRPIGRDPPKASAPGDLGGGLRTDFAFRA